MAAPRTGVPTFQTAMQQLQEAGAPWKFPGHGSILTFLGLSGVVCAMHAADMLDMQGQAVAEPRDARALAYPPPMTPQEPPCAISSTQASSGPHASTHAVASLPSRPAVPSAGSSATPPAAPAATAPNSFVAASRFHAPTAARHGGSRQSDDDDDLTTRKSAYAFNRRDPPRGSRGFIPPGRVGGDDGESAGVKRRFRPPARADSVDNEGSSGSRAEAARPRLGGRAPRGGGGGNSGGSTSKPPYAVDPPGEGEELPPELEGCDPTLVQRILAEIMDSGDPVTFDDIAGLAHVKECVREAVILPMKRPDLFTGLRAAPKGVLLFGPPGTGKTLIGKAVAAQAGATFFSISSSSIGSKWQGESERLVRTLFAVAAYKQPSVVFIDEIDSLLTMRGEGEQEITRRIKTEFLVQLDGAGTKSDTRVLVIGATNRPQELDEAARRRFTQKLYVELPHADSRQALIARLLSAEGQALPEHEMRKVVRLTRGFSGADLHNMCREAAMHVLRKTMQLNGVEGTSAANLPPIRLQDFEFALCRTRPSVAPEEVTHYIKWNGQFGSTAIEPPSDDDEGEEGSEEASSAKPPQHA